VTGRCSVCGELGHAGCTEDLAAEVARLREALATAQNHAAERYRDATFWVNECRTAEAKLARYLQAAQDEEPR
jgi:hypothetical protein